MSEPDHFPVTLLPSGRPFDAPVGVTLLAAAREAGIVLPSACRNGTCRRCLCRLLSGSISYRIEWPGLSREEKAEGFILPCVAMATSALRLEAPGATFEQAVASFEQLVASTESPAPALPAFPLTPEGS